MDNERNPKDGNQHGKFNLLHEDLRGAMYRGGAERDAVYAGYVLAFVATALFVAGIVVLGAVLKEVGVDLGDVIAAMAKDLPLLLGGLIAVTFAGCVIVALVLAQRLGGR